MTVATRAIVERAGVVGHVGECQLASLMELLLDASFLKLSNIDSIIALSQQLLFRFMLGSRRLERQKRRHASLLNCVP
jgi:hypothetical protein